ncbi:hypothetical protein FRX31_021294, partial [Thalictrum thalictroides]
RPARQHELGVETILTWVSLINPNSASFPLQLKEAPLMTSGKHWLVVDADNGKVYALGTSFNHLDVKPWVEIVDIASNT